VLFRETELPGAFVIELQKCEDERGFFARYWCQKEFEARGLNPRTVQCNAVGFLRFGKQLLVLQSKP